MLPVDWRTLRRASEIPPSVFADLARKIERGDVALSGGDCAQSCEECGNDIFDKIGDPMLTCALVEALRGHAP